MHKLAWVSLALASAACSSTDSSAVDPDAPPIAIDAPAAELPCAAGTLCLVPFLVKPQQAVTAGRLTIIWFQPMHVNGFPSMVTELAYDAPFVPGKTRYDIPLAQIHAPVNDRVLMCQWENSVCQHNATIPPIGFGLPLVLDDTSGNGKIDTPEISFYGNHGGGMAYVAWSPGAYPAGSTALRYSDGSPNYLGDIFTHGIAAGVHAYPIGSGLDVTLGTADTANGADLALCPSAGSSCQIGMPRLVGTENP